MAYKVTKNELISKRPLWLIRFLLNLSPMVYRIEDTLDSARQHLTTVISAMNHLVSLTRNGRYHVHTESDCVELRTKKDRTIVRFFIDKEY